MPSRLLPFLIAVHLCIAPSVALLGGEIELLGTVSVPGNSTDRSGLKDVLAGDIPHDRLGGFSGIEYLGDDRYLLLSDRGFGDGAVNYACRVHEAQISMHFGKKNRFEMTLTSSMLLRDEKGHHLVGSLAAIDLQRTDRGLRFDPEGIRHAPSGITWLSDEYGPAIVGFDKKGRGVKTLKIPSRFAIEHLSAEPGKEDKANRSGRQENRGLEGLAISPDGKKLFGLMQGPLLQDGGAVDEKGVRNGVNCRLLEIEIDTGRTREFVYTLDDANNGLSEILAMNAHEFLVIERDSKVGVDSKTKRIYRIDLAGAPDISDRDSLPPGPIDPQIAVKKSVFIDLLEPRFGLAGEKFPPKIEGLTFGPTLADGRRLLVVSVDNDFVAENSGWLYFFAIPKEAIGEFGWGY